MTKTKREIALDNLKKAQPKLSKRKEYIYLRAQTARNVRKEYYKEAAFTSAEIIAAEELIASKGFTAWKIHCLDCLRLKLLPDEVSKQSFIQSLEEAKQMPEGSRAIEASKEDKALHRKRQKALSRVRRTAELLIEDWPKYKDLYDVVSNNYIEAHKEDEDFKEWWPETRQKRLQ